MRRLAFAVALATAVSIPLGFFLVSFGNQGDNLLDHAQTSAERLAQYAYVQGDAWVYSRERLADLVADTQTRGSLMHQLVTSAGGQEVVEHGNRPSWPRRSLSSTILVNGESVGQVTVSATFLPLLLSTALVALFALALGGSAFVAMHLLPLRALDQTLAKLQTSFATIEAHATETTYAYEELKRQHRLVEETTQELMKARDQALAADRTKSAFLATMSHELRTPLNAIIGFSEILSGEVFGPLGSERYRDYSSSIGESGHHLLSVINDVLDISKIEAGKLELHFEELDLWGLLSDCCRLVRPTVEESAVKLELVPLETPLPELSADPVKLKQIVLNLLSNALKFTQRGGKITIDLGVIPGEGAYFSVTDTGIGMSEAELAVALEPFQQVDNGHTRKYQGTGLGLPLAKGLVEQHKGRMEVASKSGEGTVATVFLPEIRKGSAAA